MTLVRLNVRNTENQRQERASNSVNVNPLKQGSIYYPQICKDMNKPTYKELLDAGVHFGHLKKKWNPKMSPYIFMERKGIHIIDLNRTSEGLDRAANAMRALAKSGKKVLFVATKKQARDIVTEAARRAGMPYVCDSGVLS